jgi:hypothetical protein
MLANPKIINRFKFDKEHYAQVSNKTGVPVAELVESVKKFQPKCLETGIYVHLNDSDIANKTFSLYDLVQKSGLKAAHTHEFFELGEYGIADNPEQVKKHYRKLIRHRTRKFCLNMEYIENVKQEGGFRWHKNGRYIGKQDDRGEYLADSPEIKHVITYHIWELLD